MKKLIAVMVAFIVFLGVQIYIDMTRNEQERSYIDNNLGQLQYYLKPYEKNLIYSKYARLFQMQAERENTGEIVLSQRERHLREEFNQKLNRLTYKYLLDHSQKASQTEEETTLSKVDEQSDTMEWIQKLSSDLSSEDFEEVSKLYQAYQERGDKESIDRIRELLSNYPQLKVDILVDQIQDPVKIQVFFELDEQKELVPAILNPILDSLPDAEALEKAKMLWHHIKKLLSDELLSDVKNFVVYTDGQGETFAFVNHDGSGTNWYMAADVLDSYDEEGISKEFYFTVIHELGHILTLADEQVSYDASASYGIYFEEDMSAKSDSYLNQFYQRFWKDIYEDGWIAFSSEDEEDADCFYLRHMEQFTTQYASTILSEDICESFAFFVLEEKPLGNSIKEQKIRFFYEFEELVKIRDKIRENLEETVK